MCAVGAGYFQYYLAVWNVYLVLQTIVNVVRIATTRHTKVNQIFPCYRKSIEFQTKQTHQMKNNETSLQNGC